MSRVFAGIEAKTKEVKNVSSKNRTDVYCYQYQAQTTTTTTTPTTRDSTIGPVGVGSTETV